MSTAMLFRDDAYARECAARVLAAGPEGVLLDRTVFYAQAGGQPGDAGHARWEGGAMAVAKAVKGADDAVLHLPAEGAALPPVGAEVTARLDWALRHRHMRMHTSLHLLCSLIPGAGVTGGQIGAERSRLDFDLAEPPAKEWLTERLNALIAADHPVGERWITEAELDAEPGPGADAVRAAAARRRAHPPGAHRAGSARRSTSSPAAARMSAPPARSAGSR